jgi:transposase
VATPLRRLSVYSRLGPLSLTKEDGTIARRKDKKSNTKSKISGMPAMHENAAGIDVGATEMFVAVPQDRDSENVRSFPTFTQDLYRLADWLKQCKIKTVAMESTGVYWIPLFQILGACAINQFER